MGWKLPEEIVDSQWSFELAACKVLREETAVL